MGQQYNRDVDRVALLAWVLWVGCNPYRDGDFPCGSDQECGGDGMCIDDVCSFPDPGCESGYRFAARAGSDSDQCVDAYVEPCSDGDLAESFSSGTSLCEPWGTTTMLDGASVARNGGHLVLTSGTVKSYAGCFS